MPDVFLERTFDELMRSDVYAEGYLFEEDGQPQGLCPAGQDLVPRPAG